MDVPMRIAAISDIHGNLDALRAVLADIAPRGVDVIVNLGDILSGPLLPAETADLLIGLALPTIRGNHERQLLTLSLERMGESDAYAFSQLQQRHLTWIADLPASRWLTPDVFLCHGTPDTDLVYLLEDIEDNQTRQSSNAAVAERLGECNAAVILCGHSHVPRVVRLEDGRLLVNPGSVGLQGFSDNHGAPHVVQTRSPEARYALLDLGDGRWNATIVCVPYDWTRMAQLAQERGRPEWASALATGYVLQTDGAGRPASIKSRTN
jgi:predicted phosphodiesterase